MWRSACLNDVIRFDDNKVGLVIGDVSGKGIRAAVHTAEAKVYAQGLRNAGPGPRICADHPQTLACVYFHGRFHVYHIVLRTDRHPDRGDDLRNAGHETPIIIHTREREVTPAKTTGPVLGVVKECPYSKVEMALDRDATISATPMVIDVPGEKDRFGCNRLVNTLLGGPGLKPGPSPLTMSTLRPVRSAPASDPTTR